jgi:hypothetical protein
VIPAATSSLTPPGIGTAFFALVATISRQPLPPMKAATLSPGLKPVTFLPVASIVPATSAPGEKGRRGDTWYWLRSRSVSKKFSPTAVTLIKTSSGPGVGAATSSSRSF